jgi:hypothetical protein
LVDAVKRMAKARGATCYADPFVASASEVRKGLLSRTVEWLKGDEPVASPPLVPAQVRRSGGVDARGVAPDERHAPRVQPRGAPAFLRMRRT